MSPLDKTENCGVSKRRIIVMDPNTTNQLQIHEITCYLKKQSQITIHESFETTI